MSFLYRAAPERGEQWRAMFAALAPDLDCRLWPDVGDPDAVRYLGVWRLPEDVFESMANLEVVFSTGAGADQFDLSRFPPHVELVRLIDPGITEGMVEYAVMSVLMLHRRLPGYLQDQRVARWRPADLIPAARRRVGIMGLGALGRAVLDALKPFGFALSGWSGVPPRVEGVATFAGADGLAPFLGQCDILVCLLPLTSETRGILSRRTFDALPAGAGVINVGRGGHLQDDDLLDALARGQLSAAILDVTSIEPLPPTHPFWSHPEIVLTPHIAAMTHPESAACTIIDNIRRHQAGVAMVGRVDRARGY